MSTNATKPVSATPTPVTLSIRQGCLQHPNVTYYQKNVSR
jgi:hypothetical protein